MEVVDISRPRRRGIWQLCEPMLAAVWLGASTVLTAQPVNDNFADRIPLSGARVNIAATNSDATREPGEPGAPSFQRPAISHTVWWSWTAAENGVMAVSVSGSDFRAVVDVYTGDVLSQLNSVSDCAPYGWCQTVRVAVTAGTDYSIVVGSDGNAAGHIDLNLAFFSRPPNDDFTNRIHLGSSDVSVTGDNTAATYEPAEDSPTFLSFGGSVWWSWTAPVSGPVTIGLRANPTGPQDLPFVSYPWTIAVLSIFVGDTVQNLTFVTNQIATVDIAGPPLSQVTFQALAGTTYEIAADGTLNFGAFTLTIARTHAPLVLLTAPPAGAEFLAGDSVVAAAEAMDLDGTVSKVQFFVIEGFDIRTVSDVARPFRAMWTNLSAGQYSLGARAIDNLGATADAIPVTFNVRPVNDAFARRIPFTGAFITMTGTLANASSEQGEPSWTGSVWWSWTAPFSGSFTITAVSELGYYPTLAVYDGASLGNLTLVETSTFAGFGTNYSTRVVITAEAGRVYPIAVSTSGGGDWCTLSVAQTLPPSVTIISPTNDSRFVVGQPMTFTADASDADGTVRRVEYVLDDYLVLGAPTASPFTLVHTFTQGFIRHCVRAWATDDAGIATPSELVWFEVHYPGPPNDNFADRIGFTGSFVSVTGSTANATYEPEESSTVQHGSAWWAWTAPESGVVTVTVRSQDGYWPSLAVFTGTSLSNLSLVTNSAFAGRDSTYETRVLVSAQAGVTYPIAVGSRADVILSVARSLPPSVAITNPTNGATFISGEPINLVADASDPEGMVSQVEFYLYGSVQLGIVTNSPFILSLPTTNLQGFIRLQAWATDGHGLRTVSEEVQFLVRPPGPTNDHFADRISFSGSFVTVTGTTENVTLEAEENSPLLNGSAWWSWTAPVSADFTITVTSETGYWPSLAVFTGATLDSLNLITNNAYGGENTSYSTRVVLKAEAGTAYSIAVGGWGDIRLSVAQSLPPSVAITSPTNSAQFIAGQTVTLAADAFDADGIVSRVEFFLGGSDLVGVASNSPFMVNITFTEGNVGHYVHAQVTDTDGLTTFSPVVWFVVQHPPPSNDNFAARIPLTGTLLVTEGTLRNATLELDESALAGPLGSGSVWWSWTAPASGVVTLMSSGVASFLGVYTGSNVISLSVVATNVAGLPFAPLTFNAVAGNEYQIAVFGQSGFGGPFRLGLFLDARELSGPRMLSNGLFSFGLRATLDRCWIIEASTNLVHWTPVATSNCAGGPIEFLDPTVAEHPRRFYRAVEAP